MFTDSLPQTAHNSFVLAFAELGLVGVFFWVGIFYFCFKGLREIYRIESKHGSLAREIQFLAITPAASLIGFLSSAFFLSRTYNWVPYILISLSAAFVEVGRRKMNLPQMTFTKYDFRNIAAITIAGILFIYMLLKLFL